jgi:hypothetical protein
MNEFKKQQYVVDPFFVFICFSLFSFSLFLSLSLSPDKNSKVYSCNASRHLNSSLQISAACICWELSDKTNKKETMRKRRVNLSTTT